MPKKKEDNLIPVRSKNEARERGRIGGIASGKARREKKALRETLEDLLKRDLKDKELLENFDAFGFKKKGMKMQDAISAAMIAQAAKGNVKAYTAIRDTLEVPKSEEKEKAISEHMKLMREAFSEEEQQAEDDGDE